MGLLPVSAGAFQFTVTVPSPGVATMLLGAPGAVPLGEREGSVPFMPLVTEPAVMSTASALPMSGSLLYQPLTSWDSGAEKPTSTSPGGSPVRAYDPSRAVHEVVTQSSVLRCTTACTHALSTGSPELSVTIPVIVPPGLSWASMPPVSWPTVTSTGFPAVHAGWLL